MLNYLNKIIRNRQFPEFVYHVSKLDYEGYTLTSLDPSAYCSLVRAVDNMSDFEILDDFIKVF